MSTAPPPPAIHPLLARLERVILLTEAEQAAISQVPVQWAVVDADQVVIREGDHPTRSFLLAEGMACTSKVVAAGRQIISFFIPGDMPDLHSLHLQVLDSDIWAITTCRLAFMTHRDLKELCHQHPRIADELWRDTLVNASIYREWIVNLGQREAINRLAHVFCEMMLRSEAAGLAQDRSCPLPVTQEDLSEATGMSPVHVNRTLKDLRGRGLVSFGRGTLTVHNWDELVSLADFRADYLHSAEPRASKDRLLSRRPG